MHDKWKPRRTLTPIPPPAVITTITKGTFYRPHSPIIRRVVIFYPKTSLDKWNSLNAIMKLCLSFEIGRFIYLFAIVSCKFDTQFAMSIDLFETFY